jgi:hypothetical protein
VLNNPPDTKLRTRRAPARSPRGTQQGMGFGGALIILVLVIFFVNLGIVLLPSYVTFWEVRSFVNDLQETPDVIAKGTRGINSSLSSQFMVNSIRSPNTRDFKFERAPGGIKVILDYEVRKHVFANIDVVMAFHHEVVLLKP